MEIRIMRKTFREYTAGDFLRRVAGYFHELGVLGQTRIFAGMSLEASQQLIEIADEGERVKREQDAEIARLRAELAAEKRRHEGYRQAAEYLALQGISVHVASTGVWEVHLPVRGSEKQVDLGEGKGLRP